MYCLNTTNGDVWWEFQTGGEVKSSPVLDINTGLVIFGSHDQHVYALNVEVIVLYLFSPKVLNIQVI